MTMNKKPFTKKEIDFIIEAASQGKTRRTIAGAIGRDISLFSKNALPETYFQQGLDLLRDKIASEIIESNDYRDRALLANRLNIFAPNLDLKEIETIDQLKAAMGDMLVEFAKGKITTEVLNAFNKGAAQLSQLFFDQSVQAELDELREMLNQKQDKTEDYA